MKAIPKIHGVSELQRKAKEILTEAKTTGEPIFVTEHNKVSVVILSQEAYENLIQEEQQGWQKAQEKSLDFWNHNSNDQYEEMLKS